MDCTTTKTSSGARFVESTLDLLIFSKYQAGNLCLIWLDLRFVRSNHDLVRYAIDFLRFGV